jgi:hypothetical protein
MIMAVRSDAHYRTSPLRTPLTPAWSREAATWLSNQSVPWRAAGFLIGMILLAIGFSMLVFGGYTTIQGIRIPLDFFASQWGLEIETTGIPSAPWWAIPLITNFIQVFCKHIPGLNVLWRPSVVFDSLTTAIFLGFGWMHALQQLGSNGIIALILAGFLSAIVGLLITVVAEKAFLGALPIIWASLSTDR